MPYFAQKIQCSTAGFFFIDCQIEYPSSKHFANKFLNDLRAKEKVPNLKTEGV